MLATHYYAVLVLAGALTAAWLFRPRDRTQVTAFGAVLAWGLAAVLGGDVAVFDGTNETIVGNVSDGTAVAVETTGQLVAAPVPTPVRWLFGLFAVLSALAGLLYVLGVYPPTTDDPMVSGENE
jgi:heme A synthase